MFYNLTAWDFVSGFDISYLQGILYLLLYLWVFDLAWLLIAPFLGIFSFGTSVYDVDNVTGSLVHGRVMSFLTFSTLSKRSLINKVWNPKHALQGLGAAVWCSGFPKEGSLIVWCALRVVGGSIASTRCCPVSLLLSCLYLPTISIPAQHAMSSLGWSCLFFSLFTHLLSGFWEKSPGTTINSLLLVIVLLKFAVYNYSHVVITCILIFHWFKLYIGRERGNV